MIESSVVPLPLKRDGRAITIANVRERECRYPLGNGMHAALCAHPTVPDSSWCAYHAKICSPPRRHEETQRWN